MSKEAFQGCDFQKETQSTRDAFWHVPAFPSITSSLQMPGPCVSSAAPSHTYDQETKNISEHSAPKCEQNKSKPDYSKLKKPPNNYIRISELGIIFFNLNFHIWGDTLPHTEQQHVEKTRQRVCCSGNLRAVIYNRVLGFCQPTHPRVST